MALALYLGSLDCFIHSSASKGVQKSDLALYQIDGAVVDPAKC